MNRPGICKAAQEGRARWDFGKYICAPVRKATNRSRVLQNGQTIEKRVPRGIMAEHLVNPARDLSRRPMPPSLGPPESHGGPIGLEHIEPMRSLNKFPISPGVEVSGCEDERISDPPPQIVQHHPIHLSRIDREHGHERKECREGHGPSTLLSRAVHDSSIGACSRIKLL
jgi:hypothetical protein